MPHELSPDVLDALGAMRKTLLGVKAETRATGPVFLLAQIIGIQLDLIEHLLQREHEHGVSVPSEPMRFTSGPV